MGRVTDVFKKQPVRWRRGRDRMIARRGEQLGKRFQSAATCRDVNHGPHEEPNHVSAWGAVPRTAKPKN